MIIQGVCGGEQEINNVVLILSFWDFIFKQDFIDYIYGYVQMIST